MVLRHVLLTTWKYSTITLFLTIISIDKLRILSSYNSSSTFPSLAEKYKTLIQTGLGIHFFQMSEVNSKFWERFHSEFIFSKCCCINREFALEYSIELVVKLLFRGIRSFSFLCLQETSELNADLVPYE